MLKLSIILILAVVLMLAPTLSLSMANAKSASSKAKDSIIKQLGRAVEGDFTKVKMLNMTKTTTPQSVIAGVYNKVAPAPPVCKVDEVYVNGKCQAKPPTPPVNNITGVKFDFVGDFVLGGKIHDALKADNPEQIYAVGDLGYKSDVNGFISEYSDLGLGNFNKQDEWVKADMKCLVGNHDTDEDGNAKIKQQTHLLCGEFWYYKNAEAKTLVLGFNSNGDVKSTIDFFHQILTNATKMDGVKNVDIVSHKNCYTFPGAHHKVESGVKAVCDAIVKDVPQGVSVYFISAHNHNNAMTTAIQSDGRTVQKFIAGGGGKTKYQCGTGGEWVVCNTKDAFLQQTIDTESGKSSFDFVDTSGKILK